MANILLNNSCNLQCPYCFANNITAEERFLITEEELDRIVDYLLRSGQKIIGLIGGEPLIHPDFDRLMMRFIRRTQGTDTKGLVFTNGICLDQHFKILSNERFSLLINVNAEEDIGKAAYARMIRNIEEAVNEYGMSNQKLTLGLNLYKPDQDLHPFFDLVKRMGQGQCRVSVSVPQDRSENIFDYFRRFLPKVGEMLQIANDYGIGLNFDCNLIPDCLLDDTLRALFVKNESLGRSRRYVSTTRCSACSPVMDILPDGSVTRCFAMSEKTRQNIFDYAELRELAQYFRLKIDYQILNHPLSQCEDCHLRKCQKCYGGCMAFREGLIGE